jgi:putative pyoverdin transport system ATP-binding/permease protein
MLKLCVFVWRHARLMIGVAILSSVISGICRAALMWLIHWRLSNHHVSAWTFLALCVAAPLTSTLGDIFSMRSVKDAMHGMLDSLVRQIVTRPLSTLEQAGSYRILNVLTLDVGTVTGGMRVVPGMVMQSAMVAGCVGYLAWLSPTMILGVLAFVALGSGAFWLSIRASNPHNRAARLQRDEMYKYLEMLVKGIKELKLNTRRQEDFHRGLDEATNIYKHHSFATTVIRGVSSFTNQMLFFLLMGAVLFGGFWDASTDRAAFSGYAIALLFLAGPFTSLMGMMGSFSTIGASFERIEALGLHLKKARREPAETSPLPSTSWQRLRLVDVTHAYRNDKNEAGFSVGPVSLELTPGSLLFVIGGNGSGKTTLAKLLAGLYEPEKGTVLFDGQVVSSTSQSYRELFTVVFSDCYVFDTLFGCTDADAAAVRSIVDRLELTGKVEVVEGKLSTTALSQGQRKRLAMLAALVEDRPIYIFDEWAADQDPHFKRIFYRELLPALQQRGKAVVVITHDDAYYTEADHVLRVEYGKVIHQGAGAAVLSCP